MCVEKTKMKKKRPGIAHFFEKNIDRKNHHEKSVNHCCLGLEPGVARDEEWKVLTMELFSSRR